MSEKVAMLRIEVGEWSYQHNVISAKDAENIVRVLTQANWMKDELLGSLAGAFKACARELHKEAD